MCGVWSRGSKTRGRPKRTWREVVVKDCQARKLNKADAVDCSKWRKWIKDVWWSGWVWVGECFFWYRPTWVVWNKRPLNDCVCVFFICYLPSVLRCCWLGGRKGIRPVKTEWWDAGMVICLERGANLHMAQLMPLPLTVSCFSKIQIFFSTDQKLQKLVILLTIRSPECQHDAE